MITLFVLALMVCAGSHKKQRTRNRSMPPWVKSTWKEETIIIVGFFGGLTLLAYISHFLTGGQ
jgi:hypothetical protein